MEKKINNILFLTNSKGEQMVFRVLFTYHSDRFGKDYAVFYNEKDENHLLAFSYDKNLTLSKVTNSEESKELEAALHRFDEEQSKKG